MAREYVGAGWRDDLERRLAPLLDRLGHTARQRICPLCIAGLIGPGERKNVKPMAERLGLGAHDRLHHFVSVGTWDATPLLEELAGKADGRPRQRHIPDQRSQAAEAILAGAIWRSVSWRRGTKRRLSARFAAMPRTNRRWPAAADRRHGRPAHARRAGLAYWRTTYPR